eukprot:14898927-Alexandrium_andersonii.AAC.1
MFQHAQMHGPRETGSAHEQGKAKSSLSERQAGKQGPKTELGCKCHVQHVRTLRLVWTGQDQGRTNYQMQAEATNMQPGGRAQRPATRTERVRRRRAPNNEGRCIAPVSYTHLRAHETSAHL